MTTTKEELVHNIKNWLALENEIKAFIDNITTRKKHACSTDAKEGIEALQLAELIDSQSIEKD